MLRAILKLINGKEYYTLSDEEKTLLRDEEYKNVLSSYIVISNTFIVFGLIAILLTVIGILRLPLTSVTFYLEVIIVLFLIGVSILMMLQKHQRWMKVLGKVKLDLIINMVVLLCLTGMTITNIQDGGYLSLYAVGLITFALLVRVKPSIVLAYFAFVLAMVIIYINLSGTELESPMGFVVNVSALNIIIFFVSRLFFLEHINNFKQKRKITDQNSELEKLAEMDFLTSMYNRRGFARRVKEPISRPAAVFLFDLDGLKLINDAFGHEKGDMAILFTSNAIKKVFQGAFTARLGGDEFVVILEDIDGVNLEDEIHKFNKEMKNSDDLKVTVSASVGYAIAYEDSDIMETFNKAENIMYHLKLGARSSRKNRSMEALMTALYSYTGESERHCHSVGYIAQQILSEIGLSRKNDLESIKIAGQLHDIGKLSVPRHVLQKEEELNEDDWDVLRRHSEESYKITCGLIDDKDIADAVLYHHERWDGKGYPYQKRGADIPIFARILAVADSYDAMLSERYFRDRKTHKQACEEIANNSGTQFDPEIVEAFMKIPVERLKF